jgi:pilus assembly protein Flp/PilA
MSTGGGSRFFGLGARFLRDETGVTAIEYALIGALASLMIVGGVSSIGTTLQGIFAIIAAAI